MKDMNEERMKILQMVEDGKITVEEASKLLESLSCAAFCCDEEEWGGRFDDFCHGAESFLKSACRKTVKFAKDIEPQLSSFAKTAVEKTADIFDELGKAVAACLNSLNPDEPECDCCSDEDEKTPCQEKREN